MSPVKKFYSLLLLFLLLTGSYLGSFEFSKRTIIEKASSLENTLNENQKVVLDNFLKFLSTTNVFFLFSSIEAGYSTRTFAEVLKREGNLSIGEVKMLHLTLKANNEYYSRYISPLRSFYPITFGNKSPYGNVFFAEGGLNTSLPFVHYNFRGLVLYPVSALHWADLYFKNGNIEGALKILDELEGVMVLRKKDKIEYALFLNYFHFENSSVPWVSGYAQGLGAGLYAKAYQTTKNKTYLKTAKLLLNSFKIPYKEGGFVVNSPYGPWILEYGYNSNELVLNGHIIALQGLYYYWEVTKDPYAKELFDNGTVSVAKALPYFDKEGWSLYSNIHGKAMRKYHELHIQLLEWLYEKTENEIFKEYAEKWKRSLKDVR
ncbi:MAG: D-glucuronyl C5-epimerase [Thermococcales archaeon 44_46]|nr:MAG: D-glucuronyl C5-epimerase [Thermococcales archaeon 44_46]HIH73256.1 D-glucuronyl C5-epimerase [Thermococcaceae archaeon]